MAITRWSSFSWPELFMLGTPSPRTSSRSQPYWSTMAVTAQVHSCTTHNKEFWPDENSANQNLPAQKTRTNRGCVTAFGWDQAKASLSRL